jgi:hypothetical protein
VLQLGFDLLKLSYKSLTILPDADLHAPRQSLEHCSYDAEPLS